MDATAKPAHTLELSRRFEDPPERVFAAWTGPQWADWLPPPGASCRIERSDLRPDGAYSVAMTMPDGRTVRITGSYREVDPPRRLVLTWTGDYNNQETVITLTFEPDGAGTLMRLRQEGFPDAGQREGYRIGWTGAGGSFDKLAALLARGRR